MSAIPPLKQLLDLDELGKSLKKKRCVLLLGPQIDTVIENGREIPILEGLALEFARRLDAQNIPYEKSAASKLSYVSQQCLQERNISKHDLHWISKKYIEEKSEGETSIYQELAKLPVRVIVNTTPENFMLRALSKAGKSATTFSFNYEIYSGSGRNEQIYFPSISVMQPLVFNLFGNVNDPGSMVITERDQMTFIRNMIDGRTRIPNEILNLFNPENVYLFFGFNSDWHFRALMKALRLHEENHKLAPQNYSITEANKIYLRHEFNFSFIDAGMAELVREISALTAGITDIENVFISHSDTEEDRGAVERLLKIMKPLRLTNPRLRIWHRGLVDSGDVELQVAENIQNANVIIPLLSPAYLNAANIIDTELPLIQRRYYEKHAEVAPVILKPCLWETIPFFQDPLIERLPDNNLRSVIGGDLPEDEAFRSVAAAFKKRFL